MSKKDLEKPTFDVEIKATVTSLGKVEHNIKQAKEFAIELKKHYEAMIFTDELIDEAKIERASVNKTITKIADYRKDIIKEFKKPIDEFETVAKETEKLLKGASETIDKSIKDYEERQWEFKKAEINSYFDEKTAFEDINFSLIEDVKWRNKTNKLEDIYLEIDNQIETQIKASKLDKTNIELIELYAKSKGIDPKAHIVEYGYIKDIDLIKSKIDSEVVVKYSVDNADSVVNPAKIISKTFTGTEIQIKLLTDYAISVGIDEKEKEDNLWK